MSNTTTAADQSQYKSNQVRSFMLAVERALERISEGVSIDEFRAELQKIESLKNKQKRIGTMHSLLKQKIFDYSMVEINEMVDGDSLDDKFITLNELIDTSTNGQEVTPAWRPPQNVSEHFLSNLAKVKLEQKSSLKIYVQEKEESVKNLMNAIKTIRNKASEAENNMIELNKKVQIMNSEWEAILMRLRSYSNDDDDEECL